ncbi:MAG: sulfotransferase family 2 domain-containing protein [Pseudomonadota bacterium]
MGSQEKYLYLHIPKTGGVSFRQIMEDAFPVDKILHVARPADILTHTNETLDQYRFIHGHFSMCHVEHLSGFKKITSLRDPVSRCLSTYDFWRGLTDSPAWPERSRIQIRRAQALSLEGLIDHPDPLTSRHFNNVQTRMLSGIADDSMIMTAEHLEMALNNLASFEFIALNEQLEESREMLCLKFGFYFPGDPVRLNQTSVRSAVSSELVDRLKASNQLDMQLIQALQGRGLESINNVIRPF